MKKGILFCLTCLVVTGCASVANLGTKRISDITIDANDNNLVLLNSTNWDLQLKKSLSDVGFKVKNFSSVMEQTKKVDASTIVKYNEASARYGINQYEGYVIDRCLTDPSLKINEYTLELIDLKNNETILLVSKGGWTGECFLSKENIFDDLARELRNNWK